MSWDTAAPSGGQAWEAPAATFNEPTTGGGFDDFGGGQSNAFGDADNHAGFGDATGAGGAGGADGLSGGCFNCGQDGHMKSECPQPPKPRGCFNCGEEGHSKAECPNPAVAREFTGTCRICEEQGHRASDCPQKPPTVCHNCQEEGHETAKCENPRKINRDKVESISAEVAWEELKKAVAERELDDVKEAAEKYFKSTPDITYLQLESAFRSQGINVYLIALEKELSPTYTNMDLQGNLAKTYSISWRFSDKPARPKETDGWPTPEENITRLEDAGEPVDCLMPKCSNCDQLGHTQRSCPEEKMEKDRAQVKCYNCEEVGHRVRDCPNPRPDKFACRNCKQSGHSSKECPEPRSAEGVECKKCNELGHFSRDCPQGGGGGGGACHNCGQEGHRKQDCTNEKVLICRNCDGHGHLSKECPQPKDWSRVKCSNCDEMGHTKIRCKQPLKEEVGEAGYGDGSGAAYGGGEDNFGVAATGGDEFGAATTGGGGDSWETSGGGGW